MRAVGCSSTTAQLSALEVERQVVLDEFERRMAALDRSLRLMECAAWAEMARAGTPEDVAELSGLRLEFSQRRQGLRPDGAAGSRN